MGVFLVNLTRVFRLVNSFYDVLNDKHNFLSNLILVVGLVEVVQYVIDLLTVGGFDLSHQLGVDLSECLD